MKNWYVGQKIVCTDRIRNCRPPTEGYVETFPVANNIYTIRQIVVMPSNNNEIGFYLNEIHNKPQIYVEGTIEVVFWDGFFRPLVDLDKDVDISIFKKILDDVNNSVKAPEKA